MKWITVPPTGKIIDLETVSFVGPTQNNAGNGIKVVAQGHEHTLMKQAAANFLKEFKNFSGADVAELEKFAGK